MIEHQGEKLQLYLRSLRKPMELIAKDLEISRTKLYTHFRDSVLDPVLVQLLTQKGYNFELSKIESNARELDFPHKGNIVYVPLKAYGGFLHGYSDKIYMDKLERFSLPGIFGEHFAFEVQGDSMSPYANPGDVVISQKEERLEWMVKGRAYVLQTIEGIIVKIFVKIEGGKAFFKSADKSGATPVIPLKEIKGVYLVVKVLRDLMLN